MPTVVVITGNYASGKSTRLRELAADLRGRGREPITVDYDDLAQTFGSTREHGHAEHFTRLTQRVRGLAIQLALEAHRDHGADVLIVDASPSEARWRQYRDAGAEIIRLEVDAAELHARADAERPPEWHRFIDEWTPTAQAKDRWPKRPEHRKGASGREYARKRKAFLAQYTNCPSCGLPFVTDAPCEHKSCRGKGCHFHPQYPTVDHTIPLIDGAAALDVSTWRALCLRENQSAGAVIANQRRAGTYRPGHRDGVDLDWGTGDSPATSSPAAGHSLSLDW